MALNTIQINWALVCLVAIVLLARPAHAFGAGNIGSTSKIEGENWRHGDLEDTLLTLVASKAMGGKKFSKLDVKRVYFGNWLRDYSQAVDVGTVKNVSAEAIRIVLWILGFMSFGYGTKEFEVTTERLGCYRPEEHIDNPKDYADNEDARNYDRRLRGPVDERTELAIDPELGLKAYIASENLRIDTSAGLVRKLFGRSIQLGRSYARNKNKADLHEALRLLGTGCHCLEDFSAHSNYTELALIEMGERDVFPHVGRNTKVRLRGARQPVYPIVTGTFGGVDFLHSVTGEFDDKATQSEIQELQGTLQNAQNNGGDTSLLQELLNKLPDGVFGGKDEAGKADELKTNATQHQMANTRVSPRQPEEWLQYIEQAQQQIYPILEWHDEVMQAITEFIEKIPVIPEILEGVQEQINMFVFSLIAPFMLPIINQIKNELNAGSSAIISSSEDKQHIVFNDDNSSDPTHSMLSKDHFSNVLNEPAGKIAGQVLRWVVPQLIAAWDDERIDVNRTLNRIIRGVFHHPALREDGDDGASEGRQLMFSIVEKWWREKDEQEKNSLRDQLSRDGVEEGRNHKPGVQDHGHGSAKKLGMPNAFTVEYPGAPGGLGNVASAAFAGIPGGNQAVGNFADQAVGGGVLGDLVGGLAGGLAGAVGAGIQQGMSGEDARTYNQTRFGNDGSRTDAATSYSGRPGSGNYGQSQYSRTEGQGGRSEQYSSYSQQSSGFGGSGYGESRQEQHSSYGGGGYGSESRRFESATTSSYGRQEESTGYGFNGRNEYGQSGISGGYGSQQTYGSRRDDNEERPHHGRRHDDNDNDRPSHGRRHEEEERSSYGRQQEEPSYGRRRDDDQPSYGRKQDEDNSYNESSHSRQQESSGYGRRDENEGYGSHRQEEPSFGGHHSRREESGYESNTYGREQESGGYGRNERSDEYGSGGFGRRSEGFDGQGRSDEYDGGFGREERSEYGAGEGFGGRRRGEDDESGMAGGFGEEENSERRGYGQDGYGQDGYGERRGGYGY